MPQVLLCCAYCPWILTEFNPPTLLTGGRALPLVPAEEDIPQRWEFLKNVCFCRGTNNRENRPKFALIYSYPPIGLGYLTVFFGTVDKHLMKTLIKNELNSKSFSTDCEVNTELPPTTVFHNWYWIVIRNRKTLLFNPIFTGQSGTSQETFLKRTQTLRKKLWNNSWDTGKVCIELWKKIHP